MLCLVELLLQGGGQSVSHWMLARPLQRGEPAITNPTAVNTRYVVYTPMRYG